MPKFETEDKVFQWEDPAGAPFFTIMHYNPSIYPLTIELTRQQERTGEESVEIVNCVDNITKEKKMATISKFLKYSLHDFVDNKDYSMQISEDGEYVIIEGYYEKIVMPITIFNRLSELIIDHD